MPHRGEEIVKDFIDKLNARARHVVFLLGAGASCAGNLPTFAALKAQVSAALTPAPRALFDMLGANRNLEEILTRLRIIHEAVAGTPQLIDGLTAEQAR